MPGERPLHEMSADIICVRATCGGIRCKDRDFPIISRLSLQKLNLFLLI